MNQTYRPDIDGLRAVAVLAVVIFHSGFDFLSGGFVGVDVFFVISGYLITTIIYRETLARSFSYATFYTRRIKRLMPALFSMFSVTTVAAILILLPSDFLAYTKSLLWATLSFSNVYFWRENGGYFGGNAQEVPLLHTWSLAVEEQYYFTWPLFMALCLRFLSPRLTIVIVALLLAALTWMSEWIAHVTFGAAYYLLPTRMFELMIGSVLAIAWDRLPVFSQKTSNALSIVGLSAIIGSAVLLDSSYTFPGFNALYPTVGAALLILTGKESLGVANRWLATRPMVFVGLISYSVYLWHWPLIVFVRYVGTPRNAVISIALIAGSLLLGWLSWKYVEIPFRTQSRSFRRTFVRLYALPVAIVATFGIAVLMLNGIPSRFDHRIVSMDAAIASRPAELRGVCHSHTRDSDVPPQSSCVVGAKSQARGVDAMLIGDSHANHFSGFIDELAKESGLQVLDYTLDACLPVFDLEWGRNAHYADICRRHNELAKRYLSEHTPRYVILAGKWPAEEDFGKLYQDGRAVDDANRFRSIFADKLRAMFRYLKERRIEPILMKDNVYAAQSPKCPLIKLRFAPTLNCDSPRDQALARRALMDEIIALATDSLSTLKVIDPVDAMCDGSTCFAAVNDVPLYLDSTHLNDVASRSLAKVYLQSHRNPLLATVNSNLLSAQGNPR